MKHDDRLHDAALLVARTAVGASIAAHGAQKMFGWFDGPGPEGASKMMGSLGFRRATLMARLASASEVASGVLIATGAGGPLGPMMLAGVMTVAAGSVHFKNGYFAQKQGFELNAMYALIALLLAVEGQGRFSIDEAIGVREKMNPAVGWLALAAGVGTAAFVLSRRESSPPVAPPQPASQTEINTLGAPASNITPATQ